MRLNAEEEIECWRGDWMLKRRLNAEEEIECWRGGWMLKRRLNTEYEIECWRDWMLKRLNAEEEIESRRGDWMLKMRFPSSFAVLYNYYLYCYYEYEQIIEIPYYLSCFEDFYIRLWPYIFYNKISEINYVSEFPLRLCMQENIKHKGRCDNKIGIISV